MYQDRKQLSRIHNIDIFLATQSWMYINILLDTVLASYVLVKTWGVANHCQWTAKLSGRHSNLQVLMAVMTKLATVTAQ